jgi:hypothetical protein
MVDIFQTLAYFKLWLISNTTGQVKKGDIQTHKYYNICFQLKVGLQSKNTLLLETYGAPFQI